MGNWQKTGKCEFNEKCSFAHGEHELSIKEEDKGK